MIFFTVLLYLEASGRRVYCTAILYLVYLDFFKELAKMNICKNVNLFLKKLTIWTHNSCLPFYCTSKKKKQILKGILVRKLLYLDQRRFQNPVKHQWWNQKLYLHCVKCVQIRSFFWPVFPSIRTEYGDTKYISVFSPNAGKYGTEKTTRF